MRQKDGEDFTGAIANRYGNLQPATLGGNTNSPVLCFSLVELSSCHALFFLGTLVDSKLAILGFEVEDQVFFPCR